MEYTKEASIKTTPEAEAPIGELPINRAIFCGGGAPGTRVWGNNENVSKTLSNGDTYSYQMRAQARYKKFGVWFELFGRVDVYGNTVTAREDFLESLEWEYRQNCRNGKRRSGTTSLVPVIASAQFPGGNLTFYHKETIYNSTRGLRWAKLRASYQSDGGINPSGNPSFSTTYLDID